MEGTDPFNWTVNQVCGFFQHDAQEYLRRIANGPQLPALPSFLEGLRANDVTGLVLLTSVGSNDLRDEFGIPSFGHRGALLYCINELRKASSAYQGKSGKRDDRNILGLAPPTGHQDAGETSAADEPASDRVRSGEHQVEDQHGRKRRKLEIPVGAPLSHFTPTSSSEIGYFGNSSIPVDTLAFSKTGLGREIEYDAPAELTGGGACNGIETTAHNFQFQSLPKPGGELHYVYRQTRHMLRQDPIRLVRQGRTALALMPYRQNLTTTAGKVQSAMVVQYADTNDSPVAMRENVELLSYNGEYNGIAQKSLPDHCDYLEKKYGRNGQSEDGEASDGDSISSAAFDRMQAEISADWEEEQLAAKAARTKALPKADVETVVNDKVQGFKQSLRDRKQPRREAQSSSVWRMGKGSNAKRLDLVAGANTKIDCLSRRLSEQMSHIVRAECQTREQVEALCEAMEATVTDVEEEEWKIKVWQRSRRPDHVVHHAPKSLTRPVTQPSQSVSPSSLEAEDRSSMDVGGTTANGKHDQVPIPRQDSPMDHGRNERGDSDNLDQTSKVNGLTNEEVIRQDDSVSTYATNKPGAQKEEEGPPLMLQLEDDGLRRSAGSKRLMIDLTTDSDSDDVVGTPRSRRRRKVEYSSQVIVAQHKAKERQQRYRAAELHHHDRQGLPEMTIRDGLHLPIDLLKPAPFAHHIHPAIASRMKEHQIRGVRFMWRELTAGAETNEEGQGCVLAHAMGLGKTMQTITLLVALTDAARSTDPLIRSQLPTSLRQADVTHSNRSIRVLVLCPPALLQNWRSEIRQWAKNVSSLSFRSGLAAWRLEKIVDGLRARKVCTGIESALSLGQGE